MAINDCTTKDIVTRTHTHKFAASVTTFISVLSDLFLLDCVQKYLDEKKINKTFTALLCNARKGIEDNK